MANPRTWHVTGLLNHFEAIHRTEDRRIAFILGAGASLQSGIPMAGQLVDRWLRELHAREDLEQRPLAEWATAANLDIPGFEYTRAVEHYSQVFARRFEDQDEEGQADLESVMDGKEPSFGYSVLAQILAQTRHRVVITTNFDNLVADALAIYTHKLPFVCGHESLAGFVRPNPRRPLVLKIHRDLLLGPKNRSQDISTLPEALAASLRQLLANYTPIVIGYGGNDGSLMNLLGEALRPGDIPGGIYWCYWQGAGPPGERIKEVVGRHRGALIPIDGFDELMLQLGHRLGYPLMDRQIEERARKRAADYRSYVEILTRRIFPPPEPSEEEAAAEQESAPVTIDEPEAALSFSTPVTTPAAAAPREPMPAPPRPRSSDERGPLRGPLDRHSDEDRDVDSGSRRGPTRGAPSRSPAPERSRSAADEPRSEAPEPTRSGGPLGPVLSARPSTASVVASSERSDALADDAAAPTRTSQVPATPRPVAAPGSSSQAAIEPAATPLQQAAQALTSGTPEAADWWTLKLHADGNVSQKDRISAYRRALERFPDQPELIRGLALELSLSPVRGEGRDLYRRLERMTPDDPQLHLDLAVLYVHWGIGRTQAEPRAVRAWRLARSRPSEPAMLAAIAFVRGLLARRDARDDTTALRVLRMLLPVIAAPLLPLTSVLWRTIQNRLDEPSQSLYSRLLLCLRGEADPQTLQAVPRWNELTPLAPEHAWPDDPPVLKDSLEADPEVD